MIRINNSFFVEFCQAIGIILFYLFIWSLTSYLIKNWKFLNWGITSQQWCPRWSNPCSLSLICTVYTLYVLKHLITEMLNLLNLMIWKIKKRLDTIFNEKLWGFSINLWNNKLVLLASIQLNKRFYAWFYVIMLIAVWFKFYLKVYVFWF